MMNCLNCKQPIADGRKFCVNCGCPADAPDFFDANALGTSFTDVLTKKYFCFRGRAGRKEYWMFILFTWIIGFVLRILILFVFCTLTFRNFMFFSYLFGKFMFFLYLCGFGIPEAALTVRRFQDTGKKRWLALLLWGVVWGFRMISFFWMVTSGMAVSFIEMIWNVFIIPVFILACFDSQPGPNKYGPNPKGM